MRSRQGAECQAVATPTEQSPLPHERDFAAEMGVSKLALLTVLALGVGAYVTAVEDEDPFDFDSEDSVEVQGESDDGYGQKPMRKDYRGGEPGQIVFEICTS